MSLDAKKRRVLESVGWTFGDAADFLELSDEDRQLVALRVALTRKVQELRRRKALTQRELAAKMKSSQPRVAKLESNDPSVSLDLLLHGLWSAGGGLVEIQMAVKEALRGLRKRRAKRHGKSARSVA